MRPITKNFPKCLLPIKGIPILEIWLIVCLRENSFNKIFVNIHHCPEIIFSWIENWKKRELKTYGKEVIDSIKIIDESSKLLGTAGTLFWHGDVSDDFFLAYTDTHSNEMFNTLHALAKRWKENPDPPIAGLITFPVPDDGSAGTMEVDQFKTVQNFKEKGIGGMVGWAGMMFGSKEFFKYIQKEDFDLARDVLPRMNGKIMALEHVQAYDIGRGLEEYEHIRT